MCREDLGLGRGRYHGDTKQLTGGGAAYFPANNLRVSFLITLVGAAWYDSTAQTGVVDSGAAYRGNGLVGTQFMTFGPSASIKVLRIEDLGDTVTGEVSFGLTNSSTFAVLTVTEILTKVEQQPITK
jgi:hypothetical protein